VSPHRSSGSRHHAFAKASATNEWAQAALRTGTCRTGGPAGPVSCVRARACLQFRAFPRALACLPRGKDVRKGLARDARGTSQLPLDLQASRCRIFSPSVHARRRRLGLPQPAGPGASSTRRSRTPNWCAWAAPDGAGSRAENAPVCLTECDEPFFRVACPRSQHAACSRGQERGKQRTELSYSGVRARHGAGAPPASLRAHRHHGQLIDFASPPVIYPCRLRKKRPLIMQWKINFSDENTTRL